VFIAIAGNIGAGKSSLTEMLHERFGWKAYFESVDDNPYLPDFYADMKRWSFHLQVYFLSQRFITHQAITSSGADVVQDRSIYEDAEIFAKNLNVIGMMDERDFTNYSALFGVMKTYLRPPDLLVYLRAGVPTLQRQIRSRGRDFEQTISADYLERLNSLYEGWIHDYRHGEVLAIDTDDLDFVHCAAAQEELMAGIHDKISDIRGAA
jgi:deoxyadenosine/deoxycytidine kinase